jgi:hypothetical protein
MKLFLALLVAIGMSPAAVAPYLGAPECATHDPRAYHGLWNEVDGCHYDHTHGDNPHEVDGVFGTGFYDTAGGEISYPWATDGENHENHKHEGYKWFVRSGLPCESQFATGCIRAFRAQPHADLHNVASEYHSYAIEAQVCPEAQPDNCGIIRFGGWHAAGDLMIDNVQVINRTEPPRAPRPVLLHYDTVGNPNFATWYPVSPSGLVRVSTQTDDMWGVYHLPASVPVTTLGMESFDFFCEGAGPANLPIEGQQAPPACANNGSKTQPHVIGFAVPQRHRATLDPDGNGVADYQGYVNRYGAFVQGCTAVGLDCIPVSYENVVIPSDGNWQFRGDAREYDVLFDGQSPNWIRFPN